MRLSPSLFQDLVAEASLAPSVHNTQPTRWRLEVDGTASVLEDASRRLPVGDPEGRDAGISHGAAIEGFALAASARSLGITLLPGGGASAPGLTSVARLALAEGAAPDPLHPHLLTRRTYRGAFRPPKAPPGLAELERAGDVRVLTAREDIAFVAALNDAASLPAFRDGAYRAELVSWMRLSPRHPCWSLDGLNAEAMAMTPLEAAAATVVLAPGRLEALDRVGLAAPLIAERKVVTSSLAIALLHRPADEAPLQTGRRFHRFWLELEALGLSASPMAVLADNAATHRTLVQRFDLGATRRLITAWRIGCAPKPPPARSKPRLPASTLIV